MLRTALRMAAALALGAAAAHAQTPAAPSPAPAPPPAPPPPGCLGARIEACLQSLQASMSVNPAALADALARRSRIDVNGRRIGGGLVSVTATLPGRLEPMVVVLRLGPNDTVASAETTLPSDPAFARTEAEYDKTALYEMTLRLLGRRCAEIQPLAFYRFFENTVKPRISSRREDVRGGLFGGHKMFETANRVPLCGASFSYAALVEWSGADDPDFARNMRGIYTIRFD
jgi:hypothetical protein